MNNKIFQFKDYRAFLKNKITESSRQGRGLRQQWAMVMGCKLSFVSHVLTGRYNFSPEQAESLARHLKLTGEEKEYFLLLILESRAGTKELKHFYTEMINKKQSMYVHGDGNIKIDPLFSTEDQAIYYSQWYYQAIHILLQIPEYQSSAKKISKYFNLPQEVVDQVLDFLIQCQVIFQKDGKFHITQDWVHIDEKSPFAYQRMNLWRQKSIQTFDNPFIKDKLHRNIVLSAFEKDVKKIKDLIHEVFSKSVEITQDSDGDKLYSLTLELYEVK